MLKSKKDKKEFINRSMRKDIEEDMVKYKKNMTEYEKNMTEYEKNMAEYEKNIAEYKKNMAEYKKDMAEYEDDMAEYEEDILQYEKADTIEYDNTEKSMKAKKSSKKKIRFVNIYAFVMTITAIVAILLCVNFYKKEETQNDSKSGTKSIGAAQGVTKSEDTSVEKVYSDSELKSLIKDYMENNKGTLEMLREIFPENVVVFHGNQYVFIPILEDIEKNDIDNDKLKKLDTGEITYEDSSKPSHKGIDVSKFQGDIDWKKVSESGVEYAIVRVGYRGYGTGEIVADENAEKNISGALAEGIKVGVYFFSQAVTEEEAVEEAEFTINIINKYNITYPVFFDTEDIVNENDRAGSLSVDERTKVAIAFCERIRKAGYTPAIYANLKWYTMSLDMAELEDYDKWFAYYDSEIYFPYKISMWQYSESGNVDGISGKVDMNISFKEWEK